MTPLEKKLEALLKKRQTFDQKLNATQAQIKETQRRAETRLKVLVGAALITDVLHHPETRAGDSCGNQQGYHLRKGSRISQRKGVALKPQKTTIQTRAGETTHARNHKAHL